MRACTSSIMMLEMEKMILAARVTFPLDRMTFPFINSNDFSVHLGDIFLMLGWCFQCFLLLLHLALAAGSKASEQLVRSESTQATHDDGWWRKTELLDFWLLVSFSFFERRYKIHITHQTSNSLLSWQIYTLHAPIEVQ